MPEWAGEFHAFSVLHAVTVALFGGLWALLILIGLRARNRQWETRWRVLFGGFLLLCWLFANVVQLFPGRFVAGVNLPLQACDIAGILAPFALWSRQRVLLSILYFWGVGFSIQAILTPELVSGPAQVDFWTFWVPHANLTGAGCYILLVERFRPRWHDCLQSYALAVLYLALILPFDLLSGFNYGYVGPVTPSQRTILDLLGPWPWRVGSMMALAALGFALLQWPWSGTAARRSEATQ
jgi:hypothetical integral membrane protein (TIGR02206 family)